MVAFRYTKTTDLSSIEQKLSNISDQTQVIEQQGPTSPEIIPQTKQEIADSVRHINMMYNSGTITQETYQELSQKLSTNSNQISQIEKSQQQSTETQNAFASSQTAVRDINQKRETNPFSLVSEDFTASSEEAATNFAKENALAQARIKYGNNYSVAYFDTKVRLLSDGNYTSYTTAHGFGDNETETPVRITDQEQDRIVRPNEGSYDYDFAGSDDPELYGYSGSEFEDSLRPSPNVIVLEGSGTADTIDVSSAGNPLRWYPTVTYGLSLHYMTIREYNAFITGKMEYSPKENRVIIASGGRRNATLVRNKNFLDDLYITDLKVTTVIGASTMTRGSNSVIIEFTVHEPISATLIERLVALARENDIQGWIEMPLILQIDFFATTEDGNYEPSPIEGITKFILIKLNDIRLEITNKGSEYKCTAIPLSHQAFLATDFTIPVNFEITAKTIGDFFRAATDTEYDSPISGGGREEYLEMQAPGIQQSPKGYTSLSLPDALNEYQRALTKNDKGRKYQEFADEYYFVIDPDIANSSILVDRGHNLAQSPIQNDVTNRVKKDKIDINRGVFPCNAGENINAVINRVLSASEYYRKNIKVDKNSEKDGRSNQSIKLHKVLSKVHYSDEWDSIRKRYRRKIYYHIVKYDYHNHTYPNAPRSIPNQAFRNYSYIYTGQNSDIRDLKIEFNTLWFQALTAFETKTQKDNHNILDDPLSFSEGLDLSGLRPSAAEQKKKNNYEIFPYRTFTTPINQTSQQIGDGNVKTTQAVDLWNSIFNYKGGDMINLTLEIAGDPGFIVQDDLWYPPTTNERPIRDNLNSNRRQVYIFINFKMRNDIDLNTGLYSSSEYNSAFSGFYGISTIENFFRDGVFYQRLYCFRLLNQDYLTNDKRFDQASEGSRTSSTKDGLAQSSEDYEKELEQAAIAAYNENQTTIAVGNSDDARDVPDIAFTSYRDWDTVNAVNPEDYPRG